MKIKLLAAFLTLGFAASACSAEPSPSTGASASPSGNLPVQVAIVNYELVANSPNRFMVGLVLPDNRMVAYGTVQMRFQGLDAAGQPTGQVSDVVTGTYLPVPGTTPAIHPPIHRRSRRPPLAAFTSSKGCASVVPGNGSSRSRAAFRTTAWSPLDCR
jgi:hypothetical protein